MKKLLFSLMGVVLAGVLMGAAFANFADAETSTGNAASAGTMDLQLGAGNPVPFNISNVKPGDSGNGYLTLTNVGTLAGVLDINWENFVQSEGGVLTEPELAAGDYANGGDLYLSFLTAAYLDVDNNHLWDGSDVQLAIPDEQLTYNGQHAPYPGFWGGDFHFHPFPPMLDGWNNIITLQPGQMVTLVIMWQIPSTWTYPNYTQDIIQTDTLGWDIFASLEQPGLGGGVTN